MDLGLDESQEMVRDTFADFFAKECPTSVVRDAEATGFDPSLWDRFAELGSAAMGLPESLGGVGSGLLDLTLVAQECGRAVAPLPFAEVTAAGRLLASAGDEAGLLESIGAGETLVSLVVSETRPGNPGQGSATSALVPFGAVTGHVLTFDERGLGILTGEGEALASTGDGALARWRLDGERIALASPAAEPEAAALYRRAVSEWKLLTAAGLVGLAQQALAVGVEYAKSREQFDVAIAQFQAISHPLADCATRVDGAELLVRKAAWADEEEPTRFDELASMAFVFASQTAQHTAGVSLHVHGGYGFSTEYDIQLLYRRAMGWSLVAGGPRDELQKLADLRLGPLPAA